MRLKGSKHTFSDKQREFSRYDTESKEGRIILHCWIVEKMM